MLGLKVGEVRGFGFRAVRSHGWACKEFGVSGTVIEC